MIILVIILVVIIGFLIAREFLLRRELRFLEQELMFTLEHESQSNLGLSFHVKELDTLQETLQVLINRYQEDQIRRKQMVQQLREIISFIAHDVRTPLTSLQGYFELLDEAVSAEDKAQYEARIEHNLQQLRLLLDDFFTWSKVQNPEIQLELEPLSFKALFEETLLSFYPAFTEREINPVIVMDEENPLMIEADPAALERILQNLIKNALQHGKGGIECKAWQDGDDFFFSLSNLVDADEELAVERLFDTTYRSDVARSSRESSGLGLSIAKSLSQKMGFELTAKLIDDRLTFILSQRGKPAR